MEALKAEISEPWGQISRDSTTRVVVAFGPRQEKCVAAEGY